MNEFPENLQFDLGKYAAQLVDWLVENFSGFFDTTTSILRWTLTNLEDLLLWFPWWSVIIVVFLLGYRYTSLIGGITFSFLLFLVGTFGYWDLMMMTLAIVIGSVVISLIIGIPIGIFMSYSRILENIMKPILDLMQTMPTFVYLIPALILFGMGKVPAVFATIIYAVPPVIRLTSLAIQNVSKEMVEASNSFGASSWQTLKKVQLPQALPTIMTGINQTTMMALAMVVIASMIGADGLGMEVLVAINRIDIARGFEAGLGIVFLAIIIDRITQGIANKSNVSK
ncbi:ABC transporter permease [Salirhabdus salicampi]|uniref:ABC transporter permease n=1 Tax=Salirhabdus salicampi TaxID=476102 RepID=UPI0020C1F14F|nr:proline/glycine betaine ABC transporter permease [Salirhabdus salicampi]MCP8615712.1 proline/glycine betaine ABC transporter permease [Salirhabdus salicampi]